MRCLAHLSSNTPVSQAISIEEGTAMEADEYLVHGCLPLAQGSLLCIDDGREMRVHAWDGCLWITQERDRRDVTLKAGESFRIVRRGRTLIHAVRGGVIALTSPYAMCFARRIEVLRPGEARPLPVYQADRGWRGAIARLRTRFMKIWVGLYAPPPRRMAPALRPTG